MKNQELGKQIIWIEEKTKEVHNGEEVIFTRKIQKLPYRLQCISEN